MNLDELKEDCTKAKEIYEKNKDLIINELKCLGIDLDMPYGVSHCRCGDKEFVPVYTEYFSEKETNIKMKLEELGWKQHGNRINTGDGFRKIRMMKEIPID